MTTNPVGIGIGTPEPIPDGRPLAVALGGVDEGMRVALGEAIEVAGSGRDETGGDTGPKPGMLIGKHFANNGWLTDYLPSVSNEKILQMESRSIVQIDVQRD